MFSKIISFFISLFTKKSDEQDITYPALADDVSGNIQSPITTAQQESNQSDNNTTNIEPIQQNTEENTMENTQTNNNLTYNKLLVHLDAGHAEETPGKRSPSATTGLGYNGYSAKQLEIYEYEYNRLVVNEVSKKLNEIGIKTFIVTPETKKDISLTTRATRSNNMAKTYPNMNHIFISAHLNAAGDGKTWYTKGNASYWCAYTTKGKTKADALADCFYDAANEILPQYGKKIKTDVSDGDRDCEENFTVLVKTNSPAVLVESLFMTNVDDVLFLKTSEGLNAITDIYVRAVLKYYERYCK